MTTTKDRQPKTRGSASAAETPPPPFDRAKAEPIDPAIRHEPTAKTVAWRQDGWLYSATGVPVAAEIRGQKSEGRSQPAQ